MRAVRNSGAPQSATLVAKLVGDGFEMIETQMFHGPWVLGERFSTSDVYLYTLTRWLQGDQVDVQRFPKVAEHLRRMDAQPQVQKVLAAQRA